MYESPQTSSVYRCSCERAQRGKRGDAKLTSRISYLLSREKPGFTLTDAQLAETPAVFVFFFLFFFLSAQSWSLSPLRSVSRCGRRQVVFSSEYVDGKGGAERRQVGWSVTASHWCALSYVGINHDSEMTYFLTPQTNSTFNRSQGLCQTTFSPCSLSKSCI